MSNGIHSPYYRVSVKAKIYQNEKIILVKEDYKNWDLPGGGLEYNESINEALNRELMEEIGIKGFQTNNHPRIFKMIDRSANRPLLFIVFEFQISDNIKLQPGCNVEIGFFDKKDIPEDIVNYSSNYKKYIKE